MDKTQASIANELNLASEAAQSALRLLIGDATRTLDSIAAGQVASGLHHDGGVGKSAADAVADMGRLAGALAAARAARLPDDILTEAYRGKGPWYTATIDACNNEED